MVSLSKEAKRVLDRMRVLNSLIRTERATDKEFNEYRRLQPKMVESFLPLVDTLAAAGLITVLVDDPEHISPEIDGLHMEATGAFENGCIWLKADEHVGHGLRREDADDD